MAERRITRRSQTMHHKLKRDNPVIWEEPEGRPEKALVAKGKDATVEVIVKVKKNREKSTESSKKLIPLPEKGYRKGSWGDLLTNSRTSLVSKEVDGIDGEEKSRRKGVTTTVGYKKGARRKSTDEHSPLCQKIPITDDLYLETHTHIRKTRPCEEVSSKGTKNSFPHMTDLIKENEQLRNEIKQLRKEKEVAHFTGGGSIDNAKTTLASSRDWELEITPRKSRPQTQATQTLASDICSPRKTSHISKTDTDGGPNSPPKRLESKDNNKSTGTTSLPATQLETLRLETENEALRKEAAQLLTEMNRARAEYLECCSTMRELYHVAENLKRDNHDLAKKHEQQQNLQSKLFEALAENREMKTILDNLFEKQKSTHGIQDDQLSQIRNVIKDVKKTIAQEMEGLAIQPSVSALLAEKDASVYNAGGDSFLNDTNGSEIQRILRTEAPEFRRGEALEDRSSSTQYLTLGGLSTFEGRYRPSPQATSKISPRISTPNSSNSSLNISEADADVAAFRPIKPKPSSKQTTTKEVNWKMLEQEVVRSFAPVRNELSTCSTSSYSGESSSTPFAGE